MLQNNKIDSTNCFAEISKWHYVAVCIFLILIAAYYNYYYWMQLPPCGTHIWRQTDSAAFAWSYWQNGLDFFKPQIMNRSFGNGYALSELPILQYLAAIGYTFFGQHWIILKLAYVLVYLAGLLAIFYIVAYFIKDIFWSYGITLLFFAAPTLAFYGKTPIPDVAAFSFCIIGIAFLLEYFSKYKKRYFIGAFIAFVICATLKITYILPLISILSTVAIFFLFKDNPSKLFFKKKYLIALSLFFIISVCWILLLKYYNQQNNGIYFLAGINPYWNDKETAEAKAYIFHRFITEWKSRFFHTSTHYLVALCLLLNIIFWKKANKYLLVTMFLILMGSVAYFFLWYIQFYVHDYYTIPFYALYFAIFLNAIVIIQNTKQNKPLSIGIKFMVCIVIWLNVKHTKQDFNIRYNEFLMYPKDVALSDKGLQTFVRKIGIQQNDYIITVPDGSPQISLALIGNPGFTEFCEGKYDIDKIKEKKKRGAKYLIISDTLQYQTLIEQLGAPWRTYKSILFYRL